MAKPYPNHSEIVFLIIFPVLGYLILFSTFCFSQTETYVTASLVDGNNLFIEDLIQEEIEIFENDTLRQLEFMAKDEISSIYGILLDQSMRRKSMEHTRLDNRSKISGVITARNIAFGLIDKYLGRQRLWIGSYGLDLHIALDVSTDGFKAKEVIQELREKSQTKDSFLYSALFSAILKMNKCNEKRRVIILFLDTLDIETAEKINALKTLLSTSNMELFIVSLASRLDSSNGKLPPLMSQGALKNLAQVTAGGAFFATDYGEHPEEMIQDIYNQIRTFYTFGYTSYSSTENPAKLIIRCIRPGARAAHHPFSPVF